MSLYEALDQFVGAGVLACAGVVGSPMPATLPLDGAAFSRYLRELRLGEDFGAVLDAMAHEIWLAQDQRGFPQRVCEAHAAGLAGLLSEVRLSSNDLLPAIEAARRAITMPANGVAGPTAREQIAATWLARARAGDRLLHAGLIEEVARFLLEALFHYIIEQPRLLSGLKPTLVDYLQRRQSGGAPVPRPVAPPDALPTTAPPAATAAPLQAAPLQATPLQATAQPAALATLGQRAAMPPLEPPAPVARPVPAQTVARPTASTASTSTPTTSPPASTAPTAIVAASPISAAVAEIRARHGLQEGALKRFQAILAAQNMTGEQRLARLDELGAWLVATIAQLNQPSNDGPELRRLKSDAAAALTIGDLERAMDLLREVRHLVRDERRRSEARLAEEMETLKAGMIAEAEAAARLGELALARCEYETAAELFAEAAGNLPIRERALEFEYRQRQAEALAAKAEMSGDARSLAAAAQAFQASVKLIDRAAEPTMWARVHVGLGDMLMALGTRAGAVGGQTELTQSAAAFGEALAVIDRAAHPMRWALVQLSRAVALIELGNRVERDRHWLDAAQALMPALDVFDARGASDLAAAARARLRTIAGTLQPTEVVRTLTAKAG